MENLNPKYQQFMRSQKLTIKTMIQQRINLKPLRINHVRVEVERGPRGGKGINTPNRNQGTGHSSSRSSGEDNTYMDETNTFPQARKEIERIGMEHARRYEEEQGHTVGRCLCREPWL